MIEKVKAYLKNEPNSKAKEIAKKLKCTTKEVNQVLHYNPEVFIQDKASYTWTLLLQNESIVTFSDSWVDCNSFETALKNCEGDIESASKVTFVIEDGTSLFLDALARLLALCNQLAHSKNIVTVDFSDNAKVKHYLNRAGFFDHLNEKVSVLPKRPSQSTAKSYKDNSKNLVELGVVTPHEDEEAKDQLVTRLTNKFIDLTNNEYKAAISTIFAELTGNIQEHSSTELNGFAGLQKYEGIRPHIQTVISDSGLGIASTLRPSLQKHYRDLYNLYHDENLDNDIALVTRVMSGGLISRYGAGRGLGFKSSKEHALKFRAKYSVRQERFSLEFLFENGVLKKAISKTNLVKISGTHICFDFNID